MSSVVSVDVDLNEKTMKTLNEFGDKVMYTVAVMTLEYTLPHIPKDTGKMRGTSKAVGVTGSDGEYEVGSYTDYASTVWNYPDNTNWTTPDTFGRWYETIWEKNRNNFMKRAIEEAKE